MKKILLYIIAFSALASGCFTARSQDKNSVQVTNLNTTHQQGSAVIRFDLRVGRKLTKANNSLVIEPILRTPDGSMNAPLVPVVVEGKRAAVSESSRIQAANRWTNPSPFYTVNGKTVVYEARIPYESWMNGSELTLNGTRIGYYTAESVNLGLVAANLFPEPVKQEVVVSEPTPPVVVAPPVEVQEPIITPTQEPVRPATGLSTADKLAQQFTFVQPVSEFEKARQTRTGELFDYNMPLNLGKGLTTRAQDDVVRFVNGTREGALAIQFGQGRRIIDREMGDNNRTLVDLISTVRIIEQSNDSKIVRIVIAGFSSPEGQLESNERLAWDRAEAVHDFFINNSTVDPSIVHVYNGSVDWEGLRKLVAGSTMPNKLRVLQIIDNTPIWDGERNTGRHGELMRLSGGEPYKYMLQHFFPQLRQAAYIKVYYENL